MFFLLTKSASPSLCLGIDYKSNFCFLAFMYNFLKSHIFKIEVYFSIVLAKSFEKKLNKLLQKIKKKKKKKIQTNQLGCELSL